MDFQHKFLDAIQSDTVFTKTSTIQNYLPISLECPDDITKAFLSIQAYNELTTSYPYHYTLGNLDSYCLIYTLEGNGMVHSKGQNYVLQPGSIILLNCNELHRIEINKKRWRYFIVFANGTTMPFLFQSFIETDPGPYVLEVNSEIFSILHFLQSELKQPSVDPLSVTRDLFNIITISILEKKKNTENQIYTPAYLLSIKKDFDENYDHTFTLEELEEKYHISKFRICRSFRSHYGHSPVQYLNQLRMKKAKELLLCSDKRVNEIAELVGIANTNYFIRLFKQEFHTTPFKYRTNPPIL